jgi:Na+-translocating ferredoxin:NAD+ oxidoreductase subunit E
MGLGFTGVLVTLGAARELIGQGTLFAGAHMMFGEAARSWSCSWPTAASCLPCCRPARFSGWA